MDLEIIRGNWSDFINYSKERSFQHYSFDFWNTIGFSNPKFKFERTRYFSKLFCNQFEDYEIIGAFSKVGKEYNDFIEGCGETLTVNELYESVFQKLDVRPKTTIEEITSDVFELFLKHPPLITDDFFTFLNSIDLNKISISITSNTAFIPGEIVVEYLKQINIYHNFSFCLFSDTELVAKPNVQIFNRLKNKVLIEGMSIENIIHIGDNMNADYIGSRQAGLSSFYLNSNKPLIHKRNALHVIKDVQCIPFSREDYSKFKFGSYKIAEKFGLELFEYFKSAYLDDFLSNYRKIIIYSSPYLRIPTSSYYLTGTFFEAFNRHLASNRIDTVKLEFGKIERCQTYTEDYGALKAEERFDLIKNDTYQLSTIPASSDLCIFIDDISITGTHQKVVEHLLDKSGVETNSFFLYFAKLSNSDVCPSFENYLNYSFINELDKLFELINSNDYRITTRTTKYILSQKNEDLQRLIRLFIDNEKFEMWNELVEMSYSNEYHKIELYSQNLQDLEVGLKFLNN
jgi:FMN phosphatase YigB (HAD superfamily)